MKKSLIILVCCAVCFSCSAPKEESAKKQNVLFILADDLGAFDLSYANNAYYESPNIDRIANEGVQFTNGYAGAQVCSPSRATILTGKTTVAHGVTDWIGAETGETWGKNHPYTKILPPEYSMQLDSAENTLPEFLKANGYKTFFAGKWHLGAKGSWPEDHGFEINKGGWDVGNPKGGYFSPFNNPNLEDTEDGQNLSERLAKETANFIKANKDEPFFAFLSFYAVHSPIETKEAYWRKYCDKAVAAGLDSSGFKMEKRLPIRTVQDNPIYAGLIQHMDDAVGIVLRQLEDLGLDENTIIVFTSDNGGVASGDAYSTSNAPLRGGKGYHWEGGIRVPYIIKVPGLAPKVVDYPVSGQDFYPTIAELVGLSIPTNQKVDGISLKSTLDGNTPEERTLVWHYPHYGNQGGDPVSTVREGNYKLIYYWETKSSELYDLSSDLGEQIDISSVKEELAASLEQKLFDILKKEQARFPEDNPYFSEEALEDRMRQVTEKWLPSLEARRLIMLQDDFKPNEDWWGSTTID
jgi:arylsulfatase A-like enzyme